VNLTHLITIWQNGHFLKQHIVTLENILSRKIDIENKAYSKTYKQYKLNFDTTKKVQVDEWRQPQDAISMTAKLMFDTIKIFKWW